LKKPNVITIDGPAASGKSSVGLKLANILDFVFLDTGIMYRAVAWAALEQNLDIENEPEIGEMAQRIKIEITSPGVDDGRINDVYVDKVDISWKIKDPEVNQIVSQISKYKKVRQAMTENQRIFGENGKIVMAGRDIGTVVMPEADLKIFLEASPRERALRRYNEELERGKLIDLDAVIHNIEMRDKIDSSRKIAPLMPAEDAIIIYTDGKDVQTVVNEILSHIED
jgi:CMP/dCMP kinase